MSCVGVCRGMAGSNNVWARRSGPAAPGGTGEQAARQRLTWGSRGSGRPRRRAQRASPRLSTQRARTRPRPPRSLPLPWRTGPRTGARCRRTARAVGPAGQRRLGSLRPRARPRRCARALARRVPGAGACGVVGAAGRRTRVGRAWREGRAGTQQGRKVQASRDCQPGRCPRVCQKQAAVGTGAGFGT